MSPAFDLQAILAFHRVMEVMDDVDDWMLDDLIRVVLDGDANPAIRLGESGIMVLRGQLKLSADGPAIELITEAGRCLVEEDVEDAYHPFALLAVAQCE